MDEDWLSHFLALLLAMNSNPVDTAVFLIIVGTLFTSIVVLVLRACGIFTV